jgi:hypothetical protein
MSWSVSFIGSPTKVIAALDKQAESLTGQSLSEYQEALPHLKGLVAQAVGENVAVRLSASGHASFALPHVVGESGAPVKTSGNISVKLDQEYGLLA